MPSHREILKANRRARRKKYFRRGVVVTVLAMVLLSIGFWYFWNSPSFSLTHIVISGENKLPEEDLLQVIDKVLTPKSLGLLSRRVNWFYPREELRQELAEQFPELLSIEVTNSSFGTLWVEVTERQPVALWCQELKCYFLDETGLLYSPAPTFSNSPFLTLTGGALPLPIGSRPISISNFKHLLNLRSGINQSLRNVPTFSAQTVNTVSISEPVDYTFGVRDLRRETKTWRLLVARQNSATSTSLRLRVALTTPSFLTEYQLASTTLDFLDVRFDRKVFYKFM